MIRLGDTFLAQTQYKVDHLFIVIAVHDTKVLVVNITSKKDNSDTSCILCKDDHIFITHDSIVNYADAMLTSIEKIELLLKNNTFLPNRPVEEDILKKIQKGGLNSPALPKKYIKYIPTSE